MNITLDRRSKTPLSQQLEIELRIKMIRGELSQNLSLPSPEELAHEIGMSTDLVLIAYQSLTKSNHLIEKNNTWIVNYGRISKVILEKFISLYDIIQHSGAVPGIKTLAIKKDYKMPKDLGLEVPFKKVIYARRLYLANDKPSVLMDCYFPQDLYPGLFEILESDQPYYSLLKTKFNLDFGHSDRSLEAENLRKREAEILQVPTGSTYCYSIVKTFDKLNHLIEVDVCWIMPDAMHFSIEQTE